MKLLKKLLAFVLAGMTAVNTGTAAFAGSEAANDGLGGYLNEILPQKVSQIQAEHSSASIESEITEYVNQTLPYYLTNSGFYGSFDRSGIIPIHNWEGEDEWKYLVVVSKNGAMIGTLTVEYIGDDIISAFTEEYHEDLNTAINNNIPFQLGYCNDCFIIFSDNRFAILENPFFVDESFITDINIHTDELTTSTYVGRVAVSSMPRSVTYQTNPAAPTVANGRDEDGVGLCWAACVASMVMQAGNGSGFNAQYIYGQIRNSSRADKPSGKPIGTSAWIKFAFSINGMSVYNGSSLSSSTVISLLNFNKPILCDVENSTHTEAHALVLWKYSTITGTAIILSWIREKPAV